MARASHTPAFDYMRLPVLQFFRWIECANEVEREDEKERKRRRK